MIKNVADFDRFESPAVSAFVVFHSEWDKIERCLNSLSFADERLLVNISQENHRSELFNGLDVRVLDAPSADIVEEIRVDVVDQLQHDWIITIDPDEWIASSLAEDIVSVLATDPEVAGIRVPWQFYFKDDPLHTTRWGRAGQSKLIAFHRKRVSLKPYVHKGYELDGKCLYLDRDGDNVLHHEWCDSFEEFFEKHQRYIREEGKARYQKGERFSWSTMTYHVARSLFSDLLYHRGILGGTRGITLSVLRSWYEARSWLKLRTVQRDIG